jgi:hypothetical protein
MIRLIIAVFAMLVTMGLLPYPCWSYDGAALSLDCALAVKQYDAGAKKAEPSEEGLAAERCRSFILGVFSVLQSLQVNKESFVLCAPANVHQEQTVRIVAKWLKDNPSKLHLSAQHAASVSLREAFPCQKKGKPASKGGAAGKDI